MEMQSSPAKTGFIAQSTLLEHDGGALAQDNSPSCIGCTIKAFAYAYASGVCQKQTGPRYSRRLGYRGTFFSSVTSSHPRPSLMPCFRYFCRNSCP